MDRRTLLALSLVALTGCATTGFSPRASDARLERHYVLAHEDGWPATTQREPLQPKDYEQRIETILVAIDGHAREALQRHEPLRLFLFVHGGLNGYATHFDRMRQLVLGTGGPGEPVFSKTWYYPLFVNWNSALGDSIVDDLFFVRFGKRRAWLGVPTAPFVLAARLSESLFNAPTSLVTNTWTFDELEPGPLDWAEGLGRLPVTVVMTPVLKALGTSAWQIMKRRAELLVASRLDDNPANATEGAARTLLAALCRRATCDPGGPSVWRLGPGVEVPLEVTLVGHSMGALVVNRLVTAQHALPVRRIVYLAPAASIDEIEGLLAPYARAHPKTDFWVFTLSRVDEARERSAWGLLPRGTLLVWIDHLFEHVTTLGQNRSGRYKAYGDYYEGEKPAYLRYYPARGTTRRDPRTHGSFDDAEVLTGILCTVDDRVFHNRSLCDGRKFTPADPPAKRR